MKHEPVYYGEYLKLDQILNAQQLKSKQHGEEAHDETLFIIIHQTYELWFKQIIHEVDSIYKLLNTDKVKPTSLGTVNHRLNRVVEIQRILVDQLGIMETMTPLDFMDFRDYLVPASGFQSIQFRTVEVKLGLRQKYRLGIDKKYFNSRLSEKDKQFLIELEEKPTLLELLDSWLARMPFAKQEGYNFWEEYKIATTNMLDNDQKIIEANTTLGPQEREFELRNLQSTRLNFESLFNPEKHKELMDQGKVRLSMDSIRAAIFIRLFRDEPIFQIPNRMLDLLTDIDEQFTNWRDRHAIMVHRMLGTKIGTGGSSGHEYLKNSSDNNRVFTDLFNLATFLIPRSHVPKLPEQIRAELGFVFE